MRQGLFKVPWSILLGAVLSFEAWAGVRVTYSPDAELRMQFIQREQEQGYPSFPLGGCKDVLLRLHKASDELKERSSQNREQIVQIEENVQHQMIDLLELPIDWSSEDPYAANAWRREQLASYEAQVQALIDRETKRNSVSASGANTWKALPEFLGLLEKIKMLRLNMGGEYYEHWSKKERSSSLLGSQKSQKADFQSVLKSYEKLAEISDAENQESRRAFDFYNRINTILDQYITEAGNFDHSPREPGFDCLEYDVPGFQQLCGIEACRVGSTDVNGRCNWVNNENGNSCPMPQLSTQNGKVLWGNCVEGRCVQCDERIERYHPVFVFSRPDQDSSNPCVDYLPCNCLKPNKRKGYRLPDFSICGKQKVCMMGKCVSDSILGIDLLGRSNGSKAADQACNKEDPSFEARLPVLPEDILQIRCD